MANQDLKQTNDDREAVVRLSAGPTAKLKIIAKREYRSLKGQVEHLVNLAYAEYYGDTPPAKVPDGGRQ